MAYTTITMNLQGGAQTRREWLEGREYLVVPAVMMTPGVHEGNQGPLLYVDEEMGKTPSVWNYKPVTLFHPTTNQGQDGSACSPEVIERQKVGVLMNTKYPSKLATECWLDEPKLRKSGDEGVQILNDINEGRMVEVSTGLYHDPDMTPGVWNGEAYTAIVRNIRPDHLALLPGQKGACSIADGGGLLRNEDGSELSYDDVREQIRTVCKGKTGDKMPFSCGDEDSDFVWVSDIFPKYAIVERGGKVYKVGYKVRKGKVTIGSEEPEEVRKVTTYVTANGKTFVTTNEDQQGPVKTIPTPKEGDLSDVMKKRQQFDSVLKEKYSGVQQEGDWGGWTTDLYAGYAIFSKDGKHFRLPYTYDDDKIDFGDNAGFEEVERVSEYRRKNGTPIDGTISPPSSTNAGSVMNNKPTLANGTTVTKELRIVGNPQLLDSILKNQLVQNAIHQGAHAAFHEGSQGTGAHQGEPGKSDGQIRTAAEGRKGEVNSMISGGHAMEKDRGYLEGLPDDHFESVKKFALKGATLPIQPYSYEGVGDRSNAVHSAAPVQNAAVLDQVAQSLGVNPLELKEIVQNHQASKQQKRQGWIQTITSKNPAYNPVWLQQQSDGVLQNMAILASGQQQRQPTHNYGGQGDAPPMFLDNQQPQPTNNGQQGNNGQVNNGQFIEEQQTLGLPGVFN